MRNLTAFAAIIAIGLTSGAFGQVAERPKPVPVGTKWKMQTTEQAGAKERFMTMTGASSFQGKPVFLTTDGTVTYIYDAATLNNVASMRDGKLTTGVSPDEGTFSWPLSVGKTWQASFTYTDYERNVTIPGVTSRLTVIAFEDVTVPAGTFKAFRIQSTPVDRESVTRTAWYAPEPGIVVKRISERRGDTDYRGTSLRNVVELVEYGGKR